MTQVVLLNVGEPYTIEKADNVTTGYSWTVAHTDGLLVKPETSKACKNPGCGGRIRWTVFAREQGVYLFSLFHGRNWEVKKGDHPEVETYLFRVTRKNIHSKSCIEEEVRVKLYMLGETVVAYKMDGITRANDGFDPKTYDKVLVFQIYRDLKGTIIFLRGPGDQFFYLHKPDGYDMMNTLYTDKGVRLGSPSGGLTGKGDNRTNLTDMEVLVQVHID